MLKLICFLSVLSLVLANGKITFLHYPDGISFRGHEKLSMRSLSEVYTAGMGLTIEQTSNWMGMYIKDPFALAKSVVTVVVDGVSDISTPNGYTFPLETDRIDADIYETLKYRIEQREFGTPNVLINLNLAEGEEEVKQNSLLKNIKPVAISSEVLKGAVGEDFLKEVAMLKAIGKAIKGNVKPDLNPDLYWLKISSLHAISDINGANSTATNAAKTILNEALQELTAEMKALYDDQVLVSVIATDASHTRKARDAGSEGDPFQIKNLAKSYSKEYAAIFNIILWFGVVMVFSLLAVCLFIATMDPGRDSIIYRMTSTRMKKDN